MFWFSFAVCSRLGHVSFFWSFVSSIIEVAAFSFWFPSSHLTLTCKRRKTQGRLSIICTHMSIARTTAHFQFPTRIIHLFPAFVTEHALRLSLQIVQISGRVMSCSFAFGACARVTRSIVRRRRGSARSQQGSAKSLFFFSSLARTSACLGAAVVKVIVLVLGFLPEVEGIVHEYTQRFDRHRVFLQFLTLVKQPLTDGRNLEQFV